MSEPQQPDLFAEPVVPIMASEVSTQFTSLRQMIEGYIAERKAEKLDKESDPSKCLEIEQKFVPSAWLQDAARRIGHIRLATHTGKHVHPSANTSALFVPQPRAHTELVGSAVVPQENVDVVGSAASLDIYKLLRRSFEGETLLARLQRNDPEFQAALDADPEVAVKLMQSFRDFLQPPVQFTAGIQAKQVYFPLQQEGYHLLTVLYPSSLAHEVWKRISASRFGEDAKAIRQQRYAGEHSDAESQEYPDLLAQGFGGTKPQNISQLNSDRRGTMWLLPSMPPVWRNPEMPLPRKTIFGYYLRSRPVIQDAVWQMAKRLHVSRSDENHIDLRTELYGYVQTMIDDLILLAAQLQSQQENWSFDPDTEEPLLPTAEQIWLDPKARFDLYLIDQQGGELLPSEQAYLNQLRSDEWRSEVGRAFGTWLVEQLRQRLKKSRKEFEILDADEVRVYGRMLSNELQLMVEDA